MRRTHTRLDGRRVCNNQTVVRLRRQERRQIKPTATHIDHIRWQIQQPLRWRRFLAAGDVDHCALPKRIDQDIRTGGRLIQVRERGRYHTGSGKLSQQCLTNRITANCRQQSDLVTRRRQGHRRIGAAATESGLGWNAIQMPTSPQRFSEMNHVIACHRTDYHDPSQFALSYLILTGWIRPVAA